MNTSKIRKELHESIDKGDERFLRLIYAVVTAYESDEEEYSITSKTKNLLNRRLT